MAKGWSFGALTDALRSAAFVNTGSNVGEVMTIGTFGFGRKNIPIIASLDMANYAFSAGEMLYVNNNNITNKPAGMNNMVGSQAVRIQVISLADNTVTLLVTNGAERAYLVTRNGDKSFSTGEISTSFNGQMNLTASNVFNMGGTGGDNYVTMFFLNKANGNKAYIQYAGNTNELYLCAGPSGRLTLGQDGTLVSDNRFYSNNGVSTFWGATSGEFYTQGKPGSRINMQDQGLHIGWNEDNAPSGGAAAFVNNQGGGSGGFRFRNVNSNNTVQTAEWRMDGGNGNFIASGSVYAAAKLYSGNGGSFFAEDGNSYGGVWGGYLSTWLSNNINNLTSNINNRFREVRAVNQRQVNNTNGPLGGFLTGLGDFGANDGYAWISDLQLFKDSSGWVQCGIG